MTRLQKILWLGLVLLLAVAGYAFYRTHRYVEKEVSLPPRGEARYNSLYALAETLRGLGHEVDASAYLQWEQMQPQAGDVVVLASPLNSLSAAQIEQLRDWLFQGGRLLFAAPATEAAHEWLLLEDIGLGVERAKAQCLSWSAGEHSAEACSSLSLEYPHDDLIWALSYQRRTVSGALDDLLDEAEDDPVEAAAALGESIGKDEPADGLFAVKARHGEGEWIALASLKPLLNRALDKPANAALAWQLLAPWLGEAKLHMVYAVEVPPAHVVLLRYGWPVLAPLLLALLTWLWARSQSLGPPVPLAQADRRALLEHIDAAGQFAFREQRVEPLYAECRRRFDQQLQKEHPSLAALPLEAQIRALAERWQLDPALVSQALNPQQLGRADQFVQAIRTLTQMQGLS